MDKVRFGFFPDFNDPTLLFFGTAKALRYLEDAILSLKTAGLLKLEEDANFISLNHTSVTMSYGCVGLGLHRADMQSPAFTWQLSDEDIKVITGKISVVIGSDKACHHYLDGMAADAAIVISKGEYSDSFGSDASE